ncbi:MAG: hypothetical protein FWC67_02765 [Defluviitaleaceae bacterium]|nr:hypothetical protein [Defluviitaleaceae bacterium]
MDITRETLHELVENISSDYFGIVRHILVGFVREEEPLPDEIEAIERSKISIATYGTVDFDDVDWD